MCCTKVWWLALLAGCLLFCEQGMAGVQLYCDQTPRMSAAQKDRMLVLSALIKDVLAEREVDAALISRSGIDLSRFDIRYSHAGIVLRDERHPAWFVRQLYYACGERKPRIYDQGVSGFVLGVDDRETVFISLVFLPRDKSRALAHSASDNPLVLQLLSAQYSANAYAFSTTYQNCNQWVAELMAHAWHGVPWSGEQGDARQFAQDWLREMNYEPTDVKVKNIALMWLSHFYPYIHRSDHPSESLADDTFSISMPASLEHFAMVQSPDAHRMELCLKDQTLVVHEGWGLMNERCTPEEGDRVIPLQ